MRALTARKRDERYVAVQSWRRERQLPRWVVVADGYNVLPVDFDNVLMVDSFVQLIGILDALAADHDAGAALRWRLAVAGTDSLLADFQLTCETRSRLMLRLRAAFGRECREDAAFRRQLAARYRALEPDMTGLLDGHTGPEIARQEEIAACKQRSARLRRIAGGLRGLEAQKRLAVSMDQLG